MRSFRPKALSIVTPAMTEWSASYVPSVAHENASAFVVLKGVYPPVMYRPRSSAVWMSQTKVVATTYSTRVHVVGEHVTHLGGVEEPAAPERHDDLVPEQPSQRRRAVGAIEEVDRGHARLGEQGVANHLGSLPLSAYVIRIFVLRQEGGGGGGGGGGGAATSSFVTKASSFPL